LLIRQFEPVEVADLVDFAPLWEMEQAVAVYNRAIAQIGRDSMDIALIALRKLAATYPAFTQAALLYAYCLAGSGQYAAAREQLQITLDTGLMPEQQFEARDAQKRLDRLLARQAQVAAANSKLLARLPGSRRGRKVRTAAIPGAAILQKSARSPRVRVASKKERQELIRQADMPEQEQTRVRSVRPPAAILRLALIALAALLLVGMIAYAGAVWLPAAARQARERRSAQERLDWLVSQLEQRAADNPIIQAILDELHQKDSP
jgi:hypothetical protein